MRDEFLEQGLTDWAVLQEALMEVTEEQCWKLLEIEHSGKNRLQFLLRIYGRGNKLRTERERRDLMQNILPKVA